jgi:biotin synthase
MADVPSGYHQRRRIREELPISPSVTVDALQGGAGTSTNMCVNEVIAGRALELLGAPRGDHARISPTDHVNLHQSTNDTYPTALRLAAITRLRALETAIIALQEAFQAKERAFAHIVKVGRTEMQDAALVTLGREMGAYAEALGRDRWRLYKCEERLRVVNLGGTAGGTGLAAPRTYIFGVVDALRDTTGIGVARAEDRSRREAHGALAARSGPLHRHGRDGRRGGARRATGEKDPADLRSGGPHAAGRRGRVALTGEYVADLVRAIKDATGLAVTLSLGERRTGELALWRRAGADRYLLRFETSDAALYRRIHPRRAGGPASRVSTLRELRQLGYEIGSGIMVGIPGQTHESLLADLALFRELDLDMIGIGPFIPHPATPLANAVVDASSPAAVQADVLTTCKMVALARLACPEANIPATTALATIEPAGGRELGLRRGANVVMPNLTPHKYRALYEIYPGKACIAETGGHACLMRRIESIGRCAGTGPGGRRRGSSCAPRPPDIPLPGAPSACSK